MTAAQITFLAGLALVLVVVAAFGAVVLRQARTNGTGLRSPRDHANGGRAAFYAHRLTGLGIFAFLCLHILDVGLGSASPRLYDDVQRLYGTPALRVFECGLLFAVLFHTGNGIRLIAFDVFGFAPVWSRRALVAVALATLVVGAAGSGFILGPVVR